MGFKRSRVQISPARFFEIISDMVLAHALVKLSDVRSNTAPMMQSRDRGASSAPEKTRLRLAAHQLGAPRLPAPARHRSPRARMLRRAFGNGCRFSASTSESGCPSVNSRADLASTIRLHSHSTSSDSSVRRRVSNANDTGSCAVKGSRAPKVRPAH